MRVKFILFLCIVIVASSVCYASEEQVYKTAPAFVRVTTNAIGYNLLAKKVAKVALKKALNKSAKGDYKIKIDSYSGVDLKKGKFRGLVIDGENISVDDEFFVSKLHIETTSKYNYVDYNKDPIVFKNDLPMKYEIKISEEDLNKSIKANNTVSVISALIPLISIDTPKVTLLNDKLKISSALKFPFRKSMKFSMTSDLAVKNGKVVFTNVKASRNNEFTEKLIELMNDKNMLENVSVNMFDGAQTNMKVTNIKIEDKNINIDGDLVIKKAE